jgi:hypothetical protein
MTKNVGSFSSAPKTSGSIGKVLLTGQDDKAKS